MCGEQPRKHRTISTNQDSVTRGSSAPSEVLWGMFHTLLLLFMSTLSPSAIVNVFENDTPCKPTKSTSKSYATLKYAMIADRPVDLWRMWIAQGFSDSKWLCNQGMTVHAQRSSSVGVLHAAMLVCPLRRTVLSILISLHINNCFSHSIMFYEVCSYSFPCYWVANLVTTFPFYLCFWLTYLFCYLVCVYVCVCLPMCSCVFNMCLWVSLEARWGHQIPYRWL